MKILIIAPDIFPFQKGYGGRNPINIYDSLTKMGHEVSLLTSAPDHELEVFGEDGSLEKFSIVRLHSSASIPRDFEYFFPPYFREIKKVKEMVVSDRYNLIILNDFFWTLSFLSILLMGRKNRGKTVMINHGLISHHNFVLKFLLSSFNRVVSSLLVTQVAGILSYSSKSLEQIKNLTPDGMKHRKHPSCIDSSKFIKDHKNSCSLNDSDMKSKFHINGKFIFSIGATSPHKGYELLIDAFFRLQKDVSELQLIIAGQLTDHAEELMKLSREMGIEKRVRFVGPINDEEKFWLFRSCDVLVIPSLHEGFGAGAMEADVMQIKVVATNTGAHEETLEGNRFARIVDPGHVDELTDALSELISIPEIPPKTINEEKLKRYSCESLCSVLMDMVE